MDPTTMRSEGSRGRMYSHRQDPSDRARMRGSKGGRQGPRKRSRQKGPGGEAGVGAEAPSGIRMEEGEMEGIRPRRENGQGWECRKEFGAGGGENMAAAMET